MPKPRSRENLSEVGDPAGGRECRCRRLSANNSSLVVDSLCDQAGGIPEYIRKAFQKAKNEFGGHGLLLPDLVDFMKKPISSLQRVFICIDGLDGSTPNHRRELLESLQEIVRVPAGARMFLTGRPLIRDEIMKRFSEMARIALDLTQDGIKTGFRMVRPVKSWKQDRAGQSWLMSVTRPG